MAKRYTSHRRHRRHKRHTHKSMKGGAFTEQEKQDLKAQGFTNSNIDSLEDFNVRYDQVEQKINSYNGNPDDMVDHVMYIIFNEQMNDQGFNNEIIPHNDNDLHDLNDDDLNASFESHGSNLNQSQGSLHLSDLEQNSRMSGHTTDPDESFGGKKRKSRKIRKHSKKGRKTRKHRRRKQRGGTCYGRGVGANSYDPNYSIYNTNELKLFPYKP